MHRLLVPLLAAVLAAAATTALATADGGRDRPPIGPGAPFAIGLWGDVPYSPEQRTTGVPNLVADMNAQDLALSVHTGDIKSGSSRCDDDVYTEFKGFLDALEAPAFYTPGDNEWTDCDRASNGAYDAAERLALVRRTFFAAPPSLGRPRPAVVQQAAPYVENLRWRVGRVQFATLHVVGSCNNECGDAPDPAEARARDAATNRWMTEAFAEARRTNAVAVVLVAQANPGFDAADPARGPVRDPRTLAAPEGPDGFAAFLRTLRSETIAFDRPVVLVHGDSHYFRIDKPLLDADGARIQDFTRVETPGNNAASGSNDVQWVKATIDPRSREVVSFAPQVVPANAVPNRP
jgi:hypothetical protein